MPEYQYKARSAQGKLLTGQLKATSADAVATQLLNSGVTPIEIGEFKVKESSLQRLDALLRARKPGLDDLILFCRQMYTLNKAGVPLIRGLTGLAETSRNAILADILHSMRAQLEAGRELSTAMAQHADVFTPLMISMVHVGENTGRPEESFLQLAQYLEVERDTRNRIKSALRYPLFVIFAIGVAITIINIWVVPAFARVFERLGTGLPWATQVLIAVSHFFVTYWPFLLIGLVLLVIGVRLYIRSYRGKYQWDKFKLRLPLVGSIILRATLSRFAKSFAMTSRSGVPLVQALGVIGRAVDNDYVTQRIMTMRNGVERGDSLTRTAAATNLFTPLVLQMMAVGEETGAVDHMMDEVAGFYEREVDYDLKNLSAAIEPILIIAIGILVLILALGVFLPMWDLYKLGHT